MIKELNNHLYIPIPKDVSKWFICERNRSLVLYYGNSLPHYSDLLPDDYEYLKNLTVVGKFSDVVKDELLCQTILPVYKISGFGQTFLDYPTMVENENGSVSCEGYYGSASQSLNSFIMTLPESEDWLIIKKNNIGTTVKNRKISKRKNVVLNTK